MGGYGNLNYRAYVDGKLSDQSGKLTLDLHEQCITKWIDDEEH